jgi:hypothetical protein
MKAHLLLQGIILIGSLSVPCCFHPLFASERSELAEIDKKIAELEEKKRGFEAKALRHDNQAERLQFENRNFLEAKRHMELADENRMKAAQIQQEIDQLQAHRKKILNRRGI